MPYGLVIPKSACGYTKRYSDVTRTYSGSGTRSNNSYVSPSLQSVTYSSTVVSVANEYGSANIHQTILTNNDCYKAGKTMTPKGIVVHSTASPGKTAQKFVSTWNTATPGGRQVCVHAFVDDTGIYQCLPWNYQGWHAGGSANQTHIGFEICEPADIQYNSSGSTMLSGYDTASAKTFFSKAWDNAVDLCAVLCIQYGIDTNNVICHSEAHAMGIGSNHADVNHWFPKMGRSMDDFRSAVETRINNMKSSKYAVGPR